MKQNRYIAGIFLILMLIACGDDPTPTTQPDLIPTQPPANIEGDNGTTETATLAPPPTPQIIVSPTPAPPTKTPVPLAAVVNGDPILLATYERELVRYQQAQAQLGLTQDTSAHDFVLDFLITQMLIEQQAEMMGVTVDPAVVEAQVASARENAGSEADFQAWLDSNLYTLEEFNAGIQHGLLTQQLNTRITADVPFSVTQIRARYIQVSDPALAQNLRDQIVNGGDFAALASQHSLDRHTGVNGGDLGFFAPNTLLIPAVENAAFAQGVGETSDVIPIDNATLGITTYYIIQTTDISDTQPLDPAQRNDMLAQTFADWLSDIKAQADIQILVQP